jgi:hypothetical protein
MTRTLRPVRPMLKIVPATAGADQETALPIPACAGQDAGAARLPGQLSLPEFPGRRATPARSCGNHQNSCAIIALHAHRVTLENDDSLTNCGPENVRARYVIPALPKM